MGGLQEESAQLPPGACGSSVPSCPPSPGEAACSRMEPIIGRPQQPPSPLESLLTTGLALARLMEDVFLKAACSPLRGLLTCLLKGTYSWAPLAFLAPQKMSVSFAIQKANPTANSRELDLSGLKVIVARGW